MSCGHSLLKVIATLGLLTALGATMNVEAGLPGVGVDSWKEEVLLHDGQKIIVERSQTYGGRHEVGQSVPEKEHTIRFTLPNSNKSISWTSEYSEDLGRTNFNLFALHIKQGTPYLVVEPNLCLSYNKWGRPNPPYVFFKHDGREWQRVGIADVPGEFKAINLIVNTSRLSDIKEVSKDSGFVPAEAVIKINENLRQPELKTILRKPLADAGKICGEMVSNGKGSWVGMGWFSRQPSYDACVNQCFIQDFAAPYCPCITLFKGK